LSSTLSRRQFADNFLLSKFTTIFLNNHSEDEVATCSTLFEHKKVAVTCEENMGDANEY
jgi:hypothetical protein